MNPILVIVGLPIVCGIVGLIHVWRAPRYAAKPMPEMNWRTNKPRVDISEEMEELAA
jgi:hypothetical protein